MENLKQAVKLSATVAQFAKKLVAKIKLVVLKQQKKKQIAANNISIS